jgi:hypothetical protein
MQGVMQVFPTPFRPMPLFEVLEDFAARATSSITLLTRHTIRTLRPKRLCFARREQQLVCQYIN